MTCSPLLGRGTDSAGADHRYQIMNVAVTCGVVGIMLLLKLYLPGLKRRNSGCSDTRRSLSAAFAMLRSPSGFCPPAEAYRAYSTCNLTAPYIHV